jgi:hypothetical protein
VTTTGATETPPTSSQSTTTTTTRQVPEESKAETKLRALLKQVQSSKVKHKLRTTLTKLLSGALKALSAGTGNAARLNFVGTVAPGGLGTVLRDPFALVPDGLAASGVGGAGAYAAGSAEPCGGLGNFINDVKRASRTHPPQIPKPTANAWIQKAKAIETAAGCKASKNA